MLSNLAFKWLGNQNSGSVVVLLHGFMGQGDEWCRWLQPYLSEHAFLLIDLPGHGQSPAPSTAGSAFAEFHRQLVALLQAQQIQQYALYGYSLGGRLALYHASQQPTGLTRLMLESCHPGLVSQRLRLVRSCWANRWQQRFLRWPQQRCLTAWYQQSVFNSLTLQQKKAQIRQRQRLFKRRSWALALAKFSLHRQPPLASWLDKPKVTTRYIAGGEDINYARLAHRLEARGCLAQIQLCRFAGHNIHATSPKEWHNQFRQWLNSGTYHD